MPLAQDIRQALAQDRKLTFRTKEQCRDENERGNTWATQHNEQGRASEKQNVRKADSDLQTVKMIAGDIMFTSICH